MPPPASVVTAGMHGGDDGDSDGETARLPLAEALREADVDGDTEHEPDTDGDGDADGDGSAKTNADALVVAHIDCEAVALGENDAAVLSEAAADGVALADGVEPTGEPEALGDSDGCCSAALADTVDDPETEGVTVTTAVTVVDWVALGNTLGDAVADAATERVVDADAADDRLGVGDTLTIVALDDADGNGVVDAAAGDGVAEGDGVTDADVAPEPDAEGEPDADGDADGDLVSEDTSDEDTLAESVRDTETDTAPLTLVDTLADALTAAADAEALGDRVKEGQMARMTQSEASET